MIRFNQKISNNRGVGNMNKLKNNVFFNINLGYILVTGLINLYGYFQLPERMVTQISLTGGKTNTMPTPVYLLAVFVGMIIFTVLGRKSERDQKMKWFFTTTIIFIANIIMIAIQL
jgi:cytochrome bd-type quinol oxidase subunit 2